MALWGNLEQSVPEGVKLMAKTHDGTEAIGRTHVGRVCGGLSLEHEKSVRGCHPEEERSSRDV